MNRVVTQVTGQAQALETHEEQAEANLTREQRRALREEIETKLQRLHDAERAELETLRRYES
jgi:G:T/U-mismatch repair DNA glycosylase